MTLSPARRRTGAALWSLERHDPAPTDRTCGDCRHLKARKPERGSGQCRHIGSPFAGYSRDFDDSPCAWHRRADETKPLAAPCQVAPRDDLGRMFQCNWPKDRPARRGWTDRAAREQGRLFVEPPPAQRLLVTQED